FLVTGHALFRSWRRGRQIRPCLHRIVVTSAAIPMESLLIVQDSWFVTALELQNRNLGDELRLGISTSVTIGADVYRRRARVLLKQLCGKRRSAIRRIDRFVRRTF